MTTRRDPMVVLRQFMDRHRNNTNLVDARIRAAMIKAMIDGADKAEIETMARAVGLHPEPQADEPDAKD